MYRKDEFYYITDILHYNVYNVALKNHIIKEERVIVKIFKKDNEEIIIECNNGINNTIKDTRKNKDNDICNYDLCLVKVLDRYTSDYELKGMVYESIEGIGSWYRVKIDNFNPKDKDLKVFYNKKRITKEDILNSDIDDIIKDKQIRFLDIIKDIPLSNPTKVKKVLNKIVK